MRTIIFRFLLLVVMIFALLGGIDYIRNSYEDNGLQYLEDSIEMAINSAYASEGKYPDSLEDLQQDYRIIINEEKYVVFYESLGSNIRPDVKVIRKD